MDAMFRSDRYAAALGVDLVDWGGGWARHRYAARAEHENFAGGLHGGLLFSIADMGHSVASNSWGRIAVALTMEVQFLAAAPRGAALDVEARERARSRRTASYLIDVTDADGRLVASVQATAFRTGRWHLGEDAWSPGWRAEH